MRNLARLFVTALVLSGGCSTQSVSSSTTSDDGGATTSLDAGTQPAPDSGESLFGGDDSGGSSGGGFDGGTTGRSALQPTFPPTVTASKPPPPISGGTLLVTSDGKHAVVADPDRDQIYGVDLVARKVLYTTPLTSGDEPGRVAEDGAGRAHVALRSGGALVTIDEATGAVLARRAVCPAPRGVAWDSTTDLVWVACATGELVSLPAAGGAATQKWTIERDLRDVVVQGGAIAVSEFRSAQVLRIGSGGAISRRDRLSARQPGFVPHVAWRTVAGPSGALVSIYQEETTASVATLMPGGYGCGGQGGVGGQDPIMSGDSGGGGCVGTVTLSTLAIIDSAGTTVATGGFLGVLPVDVAVSRDGTRLAAAAPGDAYSPFFAIQVFSVTSNGGTFSLVAGLGPQLDLGDGVPRQATAVAFDGADDVVVQSREPAAIFILDPQGTTSHFALSTVSRADTGVDVFHTQAGAQIACASCHPEGGDDGHVWTLDGKARRTPSLRGTIAGTAPYHWPGDQPNMGALLTDVYQGRMGGAPLDPAQKSALEGWVNAIPAPPAPSWIDGASAKRGQAVFARSDVQCASCHSGPKLTDNATVDVGTGGAFQVPPLVGVGWRTPLQHDGCAATIAARFGSCATPTHGSTAGLSAQDLSDLETYLESL